LEEVKIKGDILYMTAPCGWSYHNHHSYAEDYRDHMLESHGCDIGNIQVKRDLQTGFQRINMKLKFPKEKGLYKTLVTNWTEELALAL